MKKYTLKQQPAEAVEYKRTYPTMRTVRISFLTLEKIKKRATTYKQSINDILNQEILANLEEYERKRNKPKNKKNLEQVGKRRK